MKIFLPLLICGMSVLSANAQTNPVLKGAVSDSSSSEQLENTVISVLNAKDSTLNSFTRAAKDGSFSFNKLGAGNYLLLTSYPGYADYVESFSLDASKAAHHFGTIYMTPRAKLLEDVIVRGNRAAIRLKGDTTEFNASGFVIKPNDRVEDLLVQLPGIQVDKDGKITAQGKEVDKVLVDGEEFFGDDPTLVTRNIRSDMVDKIQLYDRKSDRANLTGIDDGELKKTLNVQLKSDKKNGFFGKAEAGAGTDKFYQGQVMFNEFRDKRKFSVFGTLANTAKVGLDYGDSEKYGINEAADITGDQQDADLPMFNGKYRGDGIPVSRNAGAHYDNKWKNGKNGVNANYLIGSMNITGSRNTNTQNNLPGSFIRTDADQSFDNFLFRQKLDAVYTTRLDSTADLKFTAGGIKKESKTATYNTTASYREDDFLLNRNQNSLTNEGDQHAFQTSLLYNRKFKKPGRSISVEMTGITDRSNRKGYLNSVIDFYNDEGGLDSTQLIDQFKTNKTNADVLHTAVNFSESFSKKLSAWFSYDLLINNNTAFRRSFNSSLPGKYEELDSSLSNDYRFKQLSNQAGAIFNYKTKKTSSTFGTKAAYVNFDQQDFFTHDKLHRDFINWYPELTFKYRPDDQTTFKVFYNGSTSQPQFAQIQPFRQNTDPLNIYAGNPALRPSFTNRIGSWYQAYRFLTQRNLAFDASYFFTANDIVTSSVTDSTGKTVSRSVNLEGKNSSGLNAYFSYSWTPKKNGITLRAGTELSGNKFYSYTNGLLNTTRVYSYSGSLWAYKYNKKYNFRVMLAPSYNINQSSLQKSLNNNGWGFAGSGSFTITLPRGFRVFGDGNYLYRAKTNSFREDFRRLIVNAEFSKAFFKDQKLRVAVSGNDLLNQNTGFSRSAYNNLIIQNTNTTIGRYFMFSLIYDFNKMGGSSSN